MYRKLKLEHVGIFLFSFLYHIYTQQPFIQRRPIFNLKYGFDRDTTERNLHVHKMFNVVFILKRNYLMDIFILSVILFCMRFILRNHESIHSDFVQQVNLAVFSMSTNGEVILQLAFAV